SEARSAHGGVISPMTQTWLNDSLSSYAMVSGKCFFHVSTSNWMGFHSCARAFGDGLLLLFFICRSKTFAKFVIVLSLVFKQKRQTFQPAFLKLVIRD
ncbi:MAG: hypothetical protein DI551_12555, partial [Micavibrio aeruginosavorus]